MIDVYFFDRSKEDSISVNTSKKEDIGNRRRSENTEDKRRRSPKDQVTLSYANYLLVCEGFRLLKTHTNT